MSGAIDEDTARAINNGRAAMGTMLRTAQLHLQKVFMVFVIALMLSIYVLREYAWDVLRDDMLGRARAEFASQGLDPETVTIITMTPFDVILLQVKIGLVVGIIVSLPLLIYYARQPLRERGWWPFDRVSRWKLVPLFGLMLVLFSLGVMYGYFVFFPFVFEFLATNAYQSGIAPRYHIGKWANFIFLLTLSFGLAAQLPLAMSGLGYLEVVPYETFRDKWRYAVVGIFVFGALFSPPDPFTQVMWAVPLLFLYAFSLGLTKFIVTIRRSGEQIGYGNVARRNWNTVLGVALVAAVGVYALLSADVGPTLQGLVDRLPATYRFGVPEPGLGTGLARETAIYLWAAGAAVVGALAAFLYHLFRALDRIAAESGVMVGRTGDPAELDIGPLSAEGVRAAPIEAFASMSEDQALRHASAAMEDGDDEKARLVLDRWDDAQEKVAADAQATGATAAAANDVREGADVPSTDAPDADGATAGAGGTIGDDPGTGGGAAAGGETEPADEGNVFTRTTAGVFGAFSEDEVDEDDIGGYLWDIQFILSSLTSKTFYLVGVFMAVMAATFVALYQGGIRILRDTFLARLPPQVVGEDPLRIVALHPAEALIFEVKISVIAGLVATLPVLLYWAWPALKERGFVRGDRNMLFGWAGAVFATLIVGSIIGFLYVAPYIISALVWDAIQADMIVDYRINSFGWLVFFTTVGVGLLACVPLSMVMFHRRGLIPYRVMRDRWRVPVLTSLLLGMVASPRGVFTMFLLGIPIAATYGLGLAILWVYTRIPGTKPPKRGAPVVDD